MKREHRFTSKIAAGLFGAALALATLAQAATLEGQKPKKFLTKPLVIEDEGSFFVGGVPKVTNYATVPGPNQAAAPNQITIGQMYVEFQIPAAKKRNMPPVIMVHGSTHTGACLESTPDGREGWLPYFVRKGLSTYVVDQSGRGRSGFDESVLHEALAMMKNGDVAGATALIPAFGRITDNTAWTQWFGHLIPAGSTILNGKLIRHGDPGDPPTDDALHTDDYLPAYPFSTVDASVVARTGALGQTPAGPGNYYALDYYKQLVPNSEVTLPGSTCAACDPHEISPANTWTPENLATLVEKLGGAVVATHSQSGIMGHHMVRILKERGHLDLLKGLITIEGSCSLPNSGLTAADFDNIPYLALKGDYTATSEVCQSTVDAINARRAAGNGTAKAEYIKLDELGNPVFKGTTHMMMLGTNNLEVADVILNWADQNIPPRKTNGKKK
ncbi:MAG TPA: hypothetical protein VG096_03000 [Bryobacteraceae bacterium]|jgi:hypothetical protein|nr:hypothetical protein [Bryobacteraceae bacterium]